MVLRQVLAGEHERGGAVAGQRADPCRGRFLAVRRAEHLHVGDGAQRDQLLDRLVRRPVLADADGVVGEDIGDGQVHERGEAHRVLHVIGEDEEGRAIGAQAAVQLDAVGDRRHRVFADAEVDVAPGIVLRGEVGALFHVRLIGRRQVGRAADQVGDAVGELVQHRGARAAGRVRLGEVEKIRFLFQIGQIAAHVLPVQRRQGGVGLLVFLEKLLPFALSGSALARDRTAVFGDFVGDLEGRAGPAEVLFQLAHVLFAERRAVAGLGPREGRAVADDALADDEGGFFRLRLRLAHAAAQLVEVVRVLDVQDLPALRLEAHGHVLAEGDVRIPLDGDVVVVVKEDELAQLVRAGEGAGLVGDALFQAPVAAERVGVVVDDGEALAVEGRREVRLGERHADGVGDALAERAGRRLDAGRVAVFGMTGRLVAQLAEVDQVLFGEVVPEQIEEGIQQHGAVSRGEHEAVAVIPFRVLRVELQKVREDGIADGRAAERQAGVAGVCLLDRIRRQGADGVYRQLPNVHVECLLVQDS